MSKFIKIINKHLLKHISDYVLNVLYVCTNLRRWLIFFFSLIDNEVEDQRNKKYLLRLETKPYGVAPKCYIITYTNSG